MAWRDRLKTLWRTIRRPPRTLSLGTLTLGGFVAGVVFWGGFNTALEATNTMTFCTSCHSMENYVYAELQGTIHDTNRSGVRAGCPDCHVPHEWTDKIARKMKASKEVWGWVFGTIDEPEEFAAHRKEMAQREWKRLKANNSLECRNCHSEVAMDITRQSPRAARVHEEWLFAGKATCIDCHKGIAHKLPDMSGVPPGWTDPDLPSPGRPQGPEERLEH
ncbi:Cytochrome c-type protein NapC [Caenispirillum salinarum AK4]|uniref:Cytochrome c-type protein n=1 Tax=Caenispirillum salinarum AK4 TaxID=1238182 RepID=K9GXG4_9PROT|nr:NapC/NirT family cytochrome c [Caenispirillum salinarum]EKV29469.1 Cytochrome c-type protein NapC [Caenispirillum salinarum AK4]